MNIIRLFPLLLCQIFLINSVRAQWVMTDSVESVILHLSTFGNYIYACSATAGVYYSTDSGFNFIPANNGLENLNTRKMAIKDSLLILGTNNAMFTSTDMGQTWILSSNGFPIEDSNVEDILLRGDSILVTTWGSGIYCSVDDCASWFPLNEGFLELDKRAIYINGKRIFTSSAYSGGGIYASDNEGESWEQMNNGVPANPFDPDKLVDITSFTSIGTSLFASTRGRNVLKTEDNGENWNQLNGPNNFIWSIANIENSLFCGHDGMGISKSDDLGYSWFYVNEGIGNGPGDRVIRTFCEYGPYLYTASWSRKIFRRPVDELITSLPEYVEPDLVRVFPNPITELSRIIIPNSFQKGYILEIFDMNGQLIKRYSGLASDHFDLRRNEFSNGIYFFRVIGIYGENAFGKFVVSH